MHPIESPGEFGPEGLAPPNRGPLSALSADGAHRFVVRYAPATRSSGRSRGRDVSLFAPHVGDLAPELAD